jgi:hypothetical protein
LQVLRYSAALLAAILLLQSYFIREIVVTEILFALVLIVALALAGMASLIGYAVLLWLERPRPNHANLTLHGKRGASNHDPYVFRRSSPSARRRFAGWPTRQAVSEQAPLALGQKRERNLARKFSPEGDPALVDRHHQ